MYYLSVQSKWPHGITHATNRPARSCRVGVRAGTAGAQELLVLCPPDWSRPRSLEQLCRMKTASPLQCNGISGKRGALLSLEEEMELAETLATRQALCFDCRTGVFKKAPLWFQTSAKQDRLWLFPLGSCADVGLADLVCLQTAYRSERLCCIHRAFVSGERFCFCRSGVVQNRGNLVPSGS